MNEIAVPYEFDGRSFEGKIVYNGEARTRPSIFLQPDWTGVSPVMVEAALALAGDRYTILIADMFAKGYADRQKSFDELMSGMKAVATNRAFTIGCGKAAFDALSKEAAAHGLIDTAAPAYAVGYCAGGGLLLEQARAGLAFEALAVLHVTNPNPVEQGSECGIRGRVLAVHGAADPVTPKAKIDELERELTEAGVTWHVTMFGEGQHAFCVPKEGKLEGVHYDERLCRTTYMLVHDFFS